MVLVIGLIGFVVAKNLPALLEILLLSRMSLTSGSRYAVKTLTGYVIATTAALMVFSALGLSWGQVQWLVAALSVGIGFGLQEIVANFISGRLLNWSLSDTINRIVVTVGVDYEADVPLALALLAEAARKNKRVLEDPKPRISFEGFGDNSLTLVLRAYLGSLDDRLAVTSELHQSIHAKYRAAGIAIAFPQRDAHLSTAQPLDMRVHRPR